MRRLLTAADVEELARLGCPSLAEDWLLTPLARDRARELGLGLAGAAGRSFPAGERAGLGERGWRAQKTAAIGSRGELEEKVRRVVRRVTLLSAPDLFCPAVVEEVTRRVLARLEEVARQ